MKFWLVLPGSWHHTILISTTLLHSSRADDQAILVERYRSGCRLTNPTERPDRKDASVRFVVDGTRFVEHAWNVLLVMSRKNKMEWMEELNPRLCDSRIQSNQNRTNQNSRHLIWTIKYHSQHSHRSDTHLATLMPLFSAFYTFFSKMVSR